MDNGTRYSIECAQNKCTIVRAEPGYFCVSIGEDHDGSKDIYRSPIIAWHIFQDGAVIPICIDSESPINWVLSPDGKVTGNVANVTSSWDNLEEFLADGPNGGTGQFYGEVIIERRYAAYKYERAER